MERNPFLWRIYHIFYFNFQLNLKQNIPFSKLVRWRWIRGSTKKDKNAQFSTWMDFLWNYPTYGAIIELVMPSAQLNSMNPQTHSNNPHFIISLIVCSSAFFLTSGLTQPNSDIPHIGNKWRDMSTGPVHVCLSSNRKEGTHNHWILLLAALVSLVLCLPFAPLWFEEGMPIDRWRNYFFCIR